MNYMSVSWNVKYNTQYDNKLALLQVQFMIIHEQLIFYFILFFASKFLLSVFFLGWGMRFITQQRLRIFFLNFINSLKKTAVSSYETSSK